MRRLRVFWEALRTSLWFVPGLLVLGSIVLAQILIEVDHRLDPQAMQDRWPRLFGAGAEGARAVLATIAGSMINLAALAFSITIVALTLAASQYTSRVLRNFMRDRVNQVVLGSFVSIFVYCLLVLRTIRGTDEFEFVPVASVLFAVVLAFVGIGCLIVFIHHIASLIQAESIVRAAMEETIATIDVEFPEPCADNNEPQTSMRLPADKLSWQAIPSRVTGYLQRVDDAALLEFAEANATIVRMERCVGDFVVRGCPLASMSSALPPDDARINAFAEVYDIGRRRTMVQDAGYGVRQIVDVALKALSPGVNDTTTAVTCVQHLTAILVHLAQRQVPSRYRVKDGQLRVIASTPTFQSLAAESFDQIRQNAAGNVAILLALLQALETIADRTSRDEHRQALRRQVEMIDHLAATSIPEQRDRESLEAARVRVRKALGEASD